MIESKRAKVFGDGVEVTIRKDKQPYLAPTLRIYGTVSQFTRGQNSCNTDNNLTRRDNSQGGICPNGPSG